MSRNPKDRAERGNIISENSEMGSLEEQLAEQLEQQVGPGAYLSGQRLVATQAAPGKLELLFEGAWHLHITGDFKVQLVEALPGFGQQKKVIAVDPARQLMTGEELD